MNITFRQLRLFLALADSGSVTGAAKALHVTQPTASMQLKEIGAAVGLPLYDLVARRVRLTEAGRDLARTARRMLAEWEAFEQRVDGARGLTQGRLRVSVVSTAKYFVPRMIGDFCRTHPGVDVALEVQNRDGVVARLRDNLDDLYIMSMPPVDLSLEDRVFLDNPLVVIAPADDPLARRPAVALRDLAERRFILREPGSGTRMATDRHFRRMRFHPDIRMELGSNEAIRESVAGGLGVGVLSRHALRGTARGDGVAILDVKGFPIASRWHVVHPKGRQLSPVAEAFRTHLLESLRERPARGAPNRA